MRAVALVAVVCSMLVANAGPVSGQKVANPGSVTFTAASGLLKVGSNSFTFDESDSIDFVGSVTSSGAVTIPASQLVFPDQQVDGPFGTITIRIRANTNATGTLNPLNGATTLALNMRVDLDGGGLPGDCRIDPVLINLTSGSSGTLTGSPYNPATATARLVDGVFSVPRSTGCGLFGGQVDDAAGVPSGSGNNSADLTFRTTPAVQPAVTANLTASPGTSGQAPFAVTFSAAGSTASAGIARYEFDFTNNGSFDATVIPPATTASFTYPTTGSFLARLRVTDTQNDFTEKTLPITVTTNQPPTAHPQTVNTNEDTPADITLTGSDPANDPLTFLLVAGSGPSHGSLTGTPPNLTYDPDPGYHGPDSFQFRVRDPVGNTSGPATVTINVVSVNDLPTVDDLAVSTSEDQAATFSVTASDPEGDTLTYSTSGGPAHGTLVGAGPSYTYTPHANFSGPDSFDVTVNDGNGGTATADVDITVQPVNDPPVANNQSISTSQDTPVDFVLDATDIDGPQQIFTITGPPSHGTLSGTAPNLTYTPDAGFFGADTVAYAVSDGAGGSDTAVVSIVVNQPGNDPPVATDQEESTIEDQPVTFSLDASDPNGDPLAVTIDDEPDNGTLTGSGLSRTYTPDAAFFGDDTFSYTVADGRGGFDSATVTIHVAAVNDAPTASPQTVTTDEDTSVAVLLGATDPDGDALTYEIGEPEDGTLSGTAPNLTYTPDPGTHGLDAFTYEACDTNDECVASGVSITVVSVPDAPIAADQLVATDEDTPVDITLDADDEDGDDLTVTITAAPTRGAVAGSDLERTYTPDANVNGGDSFTYEACDPSGRCDSATVTIAIAAVNDAPTTQNQSVLTPEDTTVAVTLVGGDVDGDDLSFEVETQPSRGSLSGTAPSLVYTPAANLFGTDTFTYVVEDGNGGSAPGTISIGVFPVQDTPAAIAQSLSTPEDTTVDIVLSATDGDGDTLRYFVERAPLHGTLTGTAPSVTYKPAKDYSGPDSFEFSARDPSGRSSRATISIAVVEAVQIATRLVAQPAVVEITPLRVLRGFDARLTRTDTQAPLPGQRIDFYVGATKRCSSLTDANGTAKCTPAPAQVVTASRYEARYAGNPDFGPSAAEAPITKVP